MLFNQQALIKSVRQIGMIVLLFVLTSSLPALSGQDIPPTLVRDADKIVEEIKNRRLHVLNDLRNLPETAFVVRQARDIGELTPNTFNNAEIARFFTQNIKWFDSVKIIMQNLKLPTRAAGVSQNTLIDPPTVFTLDLILALRAGAGCCLKAGDYHNANDLINHLLSLSKLCADNGLLCARIHASVFSVLSLMPSLDWSSDMVYPLSITLDRYMDEWPQASEILSWIGYYTNGLTAFQGLRDENKSDGEHLEESVLNSDADYFALKMMELLESSRQDYFKRNMDKYWSEVTAYADSYRTNYGRAPVSVVSLPNRDSFKLVSEDRCRCEVWCNALLLATGRPIRFVVSPVTGEKYNVIANEHEIRICASNCWKGQDYQVVLPRKKGIDRKPEWK